MEYHDIAEIYAQIEMMNHDASISINSLESSPTFTHTNNAVNEDKIHQEKDDLLEKLLELEAKLEADQNRKPAHQKPQLQEE